MLVCKPDGRVLYVTRVIIITIYFYYYLPAFLQHTALSRFVFNDICLVNIDALVTVVFIQVLPYALISCSTGTIHL
jgi:hypothetical protein